jgi:hypothetical protein
MVYRIEYSVWSLLHLVVGARNLQARTKNQSYRLHLEYQLHIISVVMIVRWIDPVLTWGIISYDADAFMDTWPDPTVAALVLMAFFF